jgi:hypothetical protein
MEKLKKHFNIQISINTKSPKALNFQSKDESNKSHKYQTYGWELASLLKMKAGLITHTEIKCTSCDSILLR